MAHNDTNGARTVAEWARATNWAEVLAGADLDPAARWHGGSALDLDADGGLVWHEPDPEHDDDPEAEPVTSVVAADERLELVDGATPPEWWPVIDGQPADKLTAYAGVRGMSRAEAAKALGLNDNPAGWSWFFDRPGLEAIHEAAGIRGVNPWGVLGAALAYTAAHIPAATWSLSGSFGQGSFNLFVALCGRSGGNKGMALNTAEAVVQRDVGTNVYLDEFFKPERGKAGSAEGMATRLIPPEADNPEADELTDAEARAKAAVAGMSDKLRLRRIFFRVDELSRLYGEKRTRDSTMDSYLLSMWSNEDVGAERVKAGDKVEIAPWSYRACLVVGAQPKWVHRLASSVDEGMAQRFLYLPVVRTGARRPVKRDAAGRRVRESLPTVAIPRDVLTSTAPFWVADEVQDVMDARRDERNEREANDEPIDPFEAHRDYNQQRVAAVLSVLVHGRLEVTLEAWELAGVVMDVSDYTRNDMWRRWETTQRTDRARAEAERVTVRDDGAMLATRDRVLEIITKAGGSCTGGHFTRNITKAQREVYPAVLTELVEAGRLTEAPAKPTGMRYTLARQDS